MTRFRQVPEPSIIVPSYRQRPSPRRAEAADLHRRHRRRVHAAAARHHQPVRRAADPPEHADADRRADQRRRGLGARLRPLPAGVRRSCSSRTSSTSSTARSRTSSACSREFGAFWDSTLDRFSDLALLTGLIFLYSKLDRSDYVMIAALTLIFSIMTSYARARAESLVEKCKVGFMERPERIVLLMIGTITNRMAGVLWVVLVLSILAVADRIYYTYLALNRLPMPSRAGRRRRLQPRLLLDRRAGDAALRPLGDRDPRVRLAGPAGLARRSRWLMTPGSSPGSPRELGIRNLEFGIRGLALAASLLALETPSCRHSLRCHTFPLVLDDRRHNRD